MRRGRDRQDRPPRVGAAVLAKALVGVLLIFVSAGVGVAGAGYFQWQAVIETPPGPAPAPIPIPEAELPPPEPGGPRTLLILGSDRRAKTAADGKLGQEPNSDTIVLVRLDPKRERIAVLSLPRDLAVTIPGYADGVKINQAYKQGGARLTLKTVKHLFESATGEPFVINSVIDVNFNGFQRAVNYVKGVYVDVDRRYYNPPNSGFAEIDIQPGYQRLVGSDALAYVRYRHSDSDLYRGARQQDFLRMAANQKAVRDLQQPSDARELIKVFRRYFRFDRKFWTSKNLAGLLKTGVYLAANDAPVNRVELQGVTESEDPMTDTRLFVSMDNIAAAYDDFMTGKKSTNPKRSSLPKRAPKGKSSSRVSGLVDGRRAGEDMAVLAAKKLDFPFYFAGQVTNRTQYVRDTPRIYRLKDEEGERHQAYRIVASVGEPGEYWGVQGMTWRDPPILANPDRIRREKGRELLLFYDGRKLRMVGWKTPRAAYWVSNTLGRKISNSRLIAIAASLRRLNS
ncbi:MAG TPA: LCP family protein [Solirubrobacter sp.]|jgi:LCP family protein required for cell wall assembly|nr:LCP family protein [Solirubrobacter sp.]